MKISKQELRTALNLLKPALSKKDMIGNANCFVFKDGYVSTYNDELWFNHPIEGINKTFAIESDEILALLDKTKEETITLDLTDDLLIFQAGKSKAGFKLINAEFPVDTSIFEQQLFYDLPEDFQTAIKFAAMSASDDLINPILNCVSIKSDGTVSGTDNFRLSNWKLDTDELPFDDLLIPADSVLKILSIQPTSFMVDTDWIHFKNEDNIIASCRLVHDKFPDVSKVISKLGTGTLVTFPDDISAILSRAAIFSDNEKNNQSVTITRKGKYVVVDSETSIKGFFKERVLMETDSDDFSFIINPSFLSDILKKSKECILESNKNIISFRGDNWVYIAMLKIS